MEFVSATFKESLLPCYLRICYFIVVIIVIVVTMLFNTHIAFCPVILVVSMNLNWGRKKEVSY